MTHAARVELVMADVRRAATLHAAARRFSAFTLIVRRDLAERGDDRPFVSIVPATVLANLQHQPRDRPRFLVAYGGAELLLRAFTCGCDDYLREPWTATELELRVQRLINSARRERTFPWGEVEPDVAGVRVGGMLVRLREQERRILDLLLDRRGQVVSRDALFQVLWGRSGNGSRAVDVHVARLRGRLREALGPEALRITAARGIGYRLTAASEAEARR